MIMKEIQSILLGDRPLLISKDGYRQVASIAFLPKTSSMLGLEKTYRDKTTEALSILKKLISESDDNIQITNDYSDPDLPDNSVAYHRVWGFVTGGSRWYFSSKQLEEDLIQAEENQQICAHLLHINSVGGEAWYLDRLTETMRSCKKPIVGIYESCCASAAYYIGCHSTVLYAMTRNDFVGCIGTMTSFYDFDGYYKKMGINLVEAKATKSDLKNKTFEDLVDGKPKEYIERILDPLNDQFLAAVRSQRVKIAEMDDDNPVLRGEIYYTEEAVENGLIDGMHTFLEAVQEAYSLGKKTNDSGKLKESIYNIVR